MQKRCAKCRQVLPVVEFYRQAKARDGLQGRCKSCVKEGFAQWEAKQPPKPPRLCVQCGKPVTGGRYKLCSETCVRKQAVLHTRRYEAKRPKAVRVPMPEKSCEWCGAECGQRRWCDNRCKHKATYVPTGNKPGRKKKRKYPVSRVTRRPKSSGPFIAAACVTCGVPVVVRGADWRRARTCSTSCSRKLKRRTAREAPGYREARARGRAVRRARKRAAEKTEPIYRRKVFERDNWTCRLCKKPVAQDALVPHPKAATIDHILPLSLGGSHTYTNVQCAHFICNSKKSANVRQLSFAA